MIDTSSLRQMKANNLVYQQLGLTIRRYQRENSYYLSIEIKLKLKFDILKGY